MLYAYDERTTIGYSVPVFVLRNFKEGTFVFIATFEKALADLPSI